MAKKRAGTSRSQHIRDYLAENPTATPNQIVDALKAKGIKVSVGLASSVKYTSGPGAASKRKRKKTAGKKSGKTGSTARLTVQKLVEMKKLAQELGGIDAARKALEALETLQQ